jgi:hypothetical protein
MQNGWIENTFRGKIWNIIKMSMMNLQKYFDVILFIHSRQYHGGFIMAFYHVTLNQGRTFTLAIEAKSLSALQSFLDQVTTAKVLEIKQTVYKAGTDTRPIDDKLYKRRERFLIYANGQAVQLDIPHVPLSRSIEEVMNLIKATVEINGNNVDSVICGLSTGPELQ